MTEISKIQNPTSNIQSGATLREWQREAFTYFKKHHYCIIQAATGTGKTRLALTILQYLYSLQPRLKTLIVVPKNVILEKTWYPTLTKIMPIQDIGLFYGEVKEQSKITITNMQSIEKLNMKDYDVLICDEIHNYFSDRMQEYLKQDFLYKIGLTATLFRKDHKHWEILELFNFNMFSYDLEQGVKDKVLSEFRFYNIPIRLTSTEQTEYEELDARIAQINFAIKNKEIESKEVRYKVLDQRKKLLCNSPEKLNVLEKLAPLLKGKKIIVFNEYNIIASPTYWKLTSLGFNPTIFNTSISKKQRMQNLDNYGKGKHDVIITTRALDEGYDLPEIEVAVILAGGNTSRQMIQRAGRVLRKTDNDKDIYQVYFMDTIEEEAAMKRYELMRTACKQYSVLDVGL